MYGGDGNYGASAGSCASFTVNPLSGTQVITTVIDDTNGQTQGWTNTEQTGASAHDTAAVIAQQASIPASGTVTYNLFRNGTCTSPTASTQTVQLSSSGAVPNSTPTGPLAAGTYAFQAAYSGDANYSRAASACEPFTVASVVSEITNGSCQQFASNTAVPLALLQYQSNGQTIVQVNPGGFTYWVKVTVLGSGPQAFTITQNTTYAPTTGSGYSTIQPGPSVYNGQCHSVTGSVTGKANAAVTFTAGAAGTYYIGVKYSPQSIAPSGPASVSAGVPYLYTFTTTGVVGSKSGIALAPQAKYESLLADASPAANATVSAGQRMTIVYTDDTAIGAGSQAPTAVLSNGQVLAVTVSPTTGQPQHYVDGYGGSASTRYQDLLTFSLPAGLTPGTYVVLVTAHDGDGDIDQWPWVITVAG
jgi:hypothetical protein